MTQRVLCPFPFVLGIRVHNEEWSMTRKPILDETQNAVLLKSRRRCCLCFWLEGIDEVRKGQIAHLDQNNENSDEDNLVFLCLDHHDEYDGKTSTTKGFKLQEVRRWRDELYREMEYRFRTVKKRDFELTILGFEYIGPEDQVKVKFRLKNTGEVEARTPVVSIRLPENVKGQVPSRPPHGEVWCKAMDFDPWGMTEERQDLFEKDGRVGVIHAVRGMNPVLMPGHSTTFYGLGLLLREFVKPGATFSLDYRVDAEGMTPSVGTVVAKFPEKPEDLLVEEE